MPRSEQYTEPAVKRQEWGTRYDDGPPALRVWAVCLGGLKVVIPAFYALQDTKTPVRIGDCAMLLNIVLSAALMRPLHHGGLALATLLAAFFNLGMLGLSLYRRLGELQGWSILQSASRAACAGAGVVCYGGLMLALRSGEAMSLLWLAWQRVARGGGEER